TNCRSSVGQPMPLSQPDWTRLVPCGSKTNGLACNIIAAAVAVAATASSPTIDGSGNRFDMPCSFRAGGVSAAVERTGSGLPCPGGSLTPRQFLGGPRGADLSPRPGVGVDGTRRVR